MKRVMNILTIAGLIAIPVLIAVASWNLAADSPVHEAQAEATAALVYASLTAAAPPTATPNGTPTPSVQDVILAQMTAQSQLALTKQADDAAIEREQMALDQLRIEAQMREQSLAATYTSDAKTAVAIYAAQTSAASDLLTANAISTAGIETSVAQTEIAPFVQAEREAQAAQMELELRQKAAEVAEAELGVQRIQTTNWLIAYGPWGLGIASTFVIAKAITEWIKTRAHPRDESGRAQTIQKETKDGTVIVNPDQMETGMVKITKGGDVIRYAPMDPMEQANINRGRGIADIVGQLPGWSAQSGKSLLDKFTGSKSQPPPRIVIKPDESLSPAIEKADDLLLEEA